MKPLALTLESWEKTGLKFDHQGHSIFYRDEGEGPPLLCVHVLAHDYGDTVTQELLARYDERQLTGGAGPELASVCLLNGGLFPEVHRALLAQRLLLSPLGRNATEDRRTAAPDCRRARSRIRSSYGRTLSGARARSGRRDSR